MNKMLTSKQRAYLKGIASKEDTIFQIGKGGITDNLVTQTEGALKARELVKIRVLENSMLSPEGAAEELARKTGAEVVQTIGSRMVLFKRNPQEPKINFPRTPRNKT